MKLSVGSSTYTLVVIGDIDGNGNISITDLAKLCLHQIEKEILSGEWNRAADIDGNGNVNMTDLAQLQLVLIGKKQI